MINQTAVQISEHLERKGLQSGDALSKKQTKSIFLEGLLLKVWDNMRMYWATRPAMRLYQLAQYADTFIQLDGKKTSP